MNSHKLPICVPSESCDCARRVGNCKWFKCGQPGPQEHAYKCEVFYATAGNFSDQPARLRNIGLVVAHVLGYTDNTPHIFGTCGKLWTLAALNYRLRDGALSSSMALLLIPRPAPLALVPMIQKLGKSEKPYRPRSHRFFDTNPFSGLGHGRNGVERKLTLSHIAIAVWSAHASWLARASMGGEVNWEMWQLDHIAPPPAQLLGYEEPPHAPTKMKKSISSSMLKDLPPTSPHLVVMNPTPSPVTDGSDALSSPQPSTPPGIHHARPRSFAGFAEWEVPSTPTSTRPLGTPLSKARQRLSCSALNELAAGNVTPRPVHDAITNGTSSLRIPQRPNGPRGSPARNSIILVQNEDESMYYLANESLALDDRDSVRRMLFPPSPLRA